MFNYDKLLKNTKDANIHKIITNEGKPKRAMQSEIDYSDHKSIATFVSQSNRSKRAYRPSDTKSVLSKNNLDKLDSQNGRKTKIICKKNLIFSQGWRWEHLFRRYESEIKAEQERQKREFSHTSWDDQGE